MISFKRTGAFLLALVIFAGMFMTSCKKEEADPDKDPAKTANQLPEDSSVFPPPPFADELLSQNIYIINLDSGKEVWSTKADERIDPASVTKVMTCLLALEKVPNPKTEMVSLTTDINNYLYTAGVDTLGGIYPGESLCVMDLLYAMMLQSANEAAMMVGKYVSTYDDQNRAPEGGDLDIFAEMMNEKAKEIGALNTHFTNPTGLYDENHYSTAKDLALIAQYAWEHPDYGEIFQDIVTTNAYVSKPTNQHPDGITWYGNIKTQQSSQTMFYDPTIRGIKTGSLEERNIHNYVATATQDGYTYLASICGAPYYDEEGARHANNMAFIDSKYLFEWCFETFQVKTLVNVGDPITSVGVNMAWNTESVDVVAADKFATLVTTATTSDSINKESFFPNGQPRQNENKETIYYFDAPIKKGDELGYLKITTAGNLELGQIRLVAANTVDRSEFLYYMSIVKGFLGNYVVKFVVALVIIFIVLYVILMLIRNRNKKRYRMKRKPPRPPRR